MTYAINISTLYTCQDLTCHCYDTSSPGGETACFTQISHWVAHCDPGPTIAGTRSSGRLHAVLVLYTLKHPCVLCGKSRAALPFNSAEIQTFLSWGLLWRDCDMAMALNPSVCVGVRDQWKKRKESEAELMLNLSASCGNSRRIAFTLEMLPRIKSTKWHRHSIGYRQISDWLIDCNHLTTRNKHPKTSKRLQIYEYCCLWPRY